LIKRGVDPANAAVLLIEGSKEKKILTDGEIFIEVFARGQETDDRAVPGIVATKMVAIEGYVASRWGEQTGKQFKQRGLARTVGAKKSDTFPRRQVKINIPERPERPIGFGEMTNGYMQFKIPKKSAVELGLNEYNCRLERIQVLDWRDSLTAQGLTILT
jgi:hypothetical protein